MSVPSPPREDASSVAQKAGKIASTLPKGGRYAVDRISRDITIRRPANRAATTLPRSASGDSDARHTINQRPSVGTTAQQPLRRKPGVFEDFGDGSRTRVQADRGRTRRQAAASAPRASPPHRAQPPLRALGRVPMAPDPAASVEVDQQIFCSQEGCDQRSRRSRGSDRGSIRIGEPEHAGQWFGANLSALMPLLVGDTR